MSGVLVLEFLAVGDDSEVALLVPRVTVDRPDHLLAAAYDRVKVGDAVMRSAVHGGETLPHGFRGHRHTSVDQVLRADLNVAHGSAALAVLVDGTAAAVSFERTPCKCDCCMAWQGRTHRLMTRISCRGPGWSR